MTGPREPVSAAERDPAAQPERTRLAWRRTTLTYAVSLGLAVRAVLTEGAPAAAVAGVALAALAWLGFLAVAHRRIQQMVTERPPRGLTVLQLRGTLASVLTLIVVGVVLL
ncbi:DUF202 domain-containing protein [Streptomyces boncukensis]|uniref:DUF202 domain-containing protein n=1 Tax=Streptomyces boncukensis TaxID=2711219 RepID=A0A6G4WZS3_9ACTN|nr:DUF202 domain-containing protein [Streptomyces boncukensis]